MDLAELAQKNIPMGSLTSPKKGEHKIRAMVFDTYGTVCDFYGPFKRRFEQLAQDKGVECDAGAMTIAWRGAYVVTSFTQAVTGSEFRPLVESQRANLITVLAEHFPAPVSDQDIDEITKTWDRLDPWPDAIEGLHRLKELAVIAPLSNGNFIDMINNARYAKLPWDVILGASVARCYKPHPDIYLKSIEALNMQPEEVCMVAAHQYDLSYAASFGMQTAFVGRPDEFGGIIKPKTPEEGVSYLNAAEIHVEGDWTYVADNLIDLAEQIEKVQS
jgi:2-haloacid dehalogenase